MRYEEAYKWAIYYRGALQPGCRRLEIAGGVRRHKADPHDIELVAMSLPGHPPLQFGQPAHPTFLEAKIAELQFSCQIRAVKDGPKYKQFEALGDSGHFSIDLFIVSYPADWGVIYMIRTGPADFSHWIVTPQSMGGALPDGHEVKDGAVWRIEDHQKITLPEEGDFFDFLKIPFILPEERRAQWKRRDKWQI